MLLAGIFPAKRTQQKLVDCSEISSSIIQTHKIPSKPITISPLCSSKKKAKSYGDVTLVFTESIMSSIRHQTHLLSYMHTCSRAVNRRTHLDLWFFFQWCIECSPRWEYKWIFGAWAHHNYNANTKYSTFKKSASFRKNTPSLTMLSFLIRLLSWHVSQHSEIRESIQKYNLVLSGLASFNVSWQNLYSPEGYKFKKKKYTENYYETTSFYHWRKNQQLLNWIRYWWRWQK